MIGKIATRPRAPHEALHRSAGLSLGLVFARRRGQFLKLQFELVEQALAALRARPEHRALHLLDQKPKMLDQRMGASQLGTRLDQLRLERVEVVGDWIGCRRHARNCTTIGVIRG